MYIHVISGILSSMCIWHAPFLSVFTNHAFLMKNLTVLQQKPFPGRETLAYMNYIPVTINTVVRDIMKMYKHCSVIYSCFMINALYYCVNSCLELIFLLNQFKRNLLTFYIALIRTFYSGLLSIMSQIAWMTWALKNMGKYKYLVFLEDQAKCKLRITSLLYRDKQNYG